GRGRRAARVISDAVGLIGTSPMATLETRSSTDVRAEPPVRPFDPITARRSAGVLSILGGLSLWELVSRFVVANPLFLAAPTQIVAATYSLAARGELWPHVWISTIEFALGYVIASLLGIGLGMAMAQSEVV